MRGKRGKILKNFPSLPPRPHLSFQNFLIFTDRMTGGERKWKRGKRGGNLWKEPCVRNVPFVQDTLYKLRNLYDGHCV